MNAKEEFIKHIGNRSLKCAHIVFGDDYFDEEYKTHAILKVGYSTEDYERFLSVLNRNYDEGYGGQNLFGTIWYKGGTWSSRGEYDGSEWWEYNSCPKIPKNLI